MQIVRTEVAKVIRSSSLDSHALGKMVKVLVSDTGRYFLEEYSYRYGFLVLNEIDENDILEFDV